MITLRNFNENDISTLKKNRYPNKTEAEIAELLSLWQKVEYNGKYFEIFAVINDDRVVGSVSVFEISRGIASLGPEIFEAERQKGYAKRAMLLAERKAKAVGFNKLLQQIKTDNTASLSLHKSLGYIESGGKEINKKGNEVVYYLKELL